MYIIKMLQNRICLFFLIFVVVIAGCTKKQPVDPKLYLRDPLFFDVKTDKDSALVLDNLKKYARLFAFPAVKDETRAVYKISGWIKVKGVEPAKLKGVVIEYNWEVSADIEISETGSGSIVEKITIPPYEVGAADKGRAFRRAVMTGATKLAQFIFFDGKVLGQKDVRDLLADLLIEKDKGFQYNSIIDKLVAAGKKAVPFLIWKMDDRRKVQMDGDLPELTDENAHNVAVYHVANRALERIFNCKTGLVVTEKSDFNYIKQLRVAWVVRWSKFCGSYLKAEQLKELLKLKAKLKDQGSSKQEDKKNVNDTKKQSTGANE